MSLLDEVRRRCAEIAASATDVRIELNALDALEPAPPPALDPRFHYLGGSPEDIADFTLALDAINFGSGWFPTLRKRTLDGQQLSGYFTVALGFTERANAEGPPTSAWLRQVSAQEIAAILQQDAGNELMSLYAQALRMLGGMLGDRRALDLVRHTKHSAESLTEALAKSMPFFDDRGFYKRAQIVASDLELAGACDFEDLDRLTIFADNLVPHVLRCDGVLSYSPELAAHIDAGEILSLGGPEAEIRACALHACELIWKRTNVPPRTLDHWLWNRGQAPTYKALPRHRCRTVFY